MSVGKRHARNWVTLAIATVTCLALGEVAARLSMRDITTTADNRSFAAIKWKRWHVSLNSEGFRDREFDFPKSPGQRRVAVIGDSFTFGQGIAEQERMSNILERELRKRWTNVDVLNLGRAGHNTYDELRVLQHVLSIDAPDLVLLQWFVNDVEGNPSPELQSDRASLAVELASPQTPGRTDVPRASVVTRVKMTLRNHSALYFLAANAWHRVRALGIRYEFELRDRFDDPDSEESFAANAALSEFVAACKAAGIPVAIVLVPMLTPLGSAEYPYAFLHERVLQTCAANGIPCLDLFGEFEPYLRDPVAYKQLWVNRFDWHMSAFANQLAAMALMPVVESLLQEGDLNQETDVHPIDSDEPGTPADVEGNTDLDAITV